MKPNKKFSLAKRLKSFKYAFEGIITLFKEEHNARIHLVAAIVAIIFGFYFDINATEWIFISFAIGFVFCAELLNSAIENLSDFCTKEQNSFIKNAKDMSAAAVLVAAITSIIIGLIVFIPKFIN